MLFVLVARPLLVSCIKILIALPVFHAYGPVATVTAHHLYLTVQHWCCDPFAFCKPVAKIPSDRDALIRAACSGNPKFFL
jgi:dihydroorotase